MVKIKDPRSPLPISEHLPISDLRRGGRVEKGRGRGEGWWRRRCVVGRKGKEEGGGRAHLSRSLLGGKRAGSSTEEGGGIREEGGQRRYDIGGRRDDIG